MKRINKATFIDLLMIALGCAIYGISLDMISVPNKLADGGLSGISLILRHFWGINMGLSTLILNIPLILLGYRFMGKRLLAYTIWGTVSLSFFLWFWRSVPIIKQLDLEHDLFLSAISAGVLSGIGLGLVFRYNGTSGGTDIIARICQIKFGISSGKMLLFCDAVVLFASLFRDIAIAPLVKSRSTIKTFLFNLESVPASDKRVVVLPTPPFPP